MCPAQILEINIYRSHGSYVEQLPRRRPQSSRGNRLTRLEVSVCPALVELFAAENRLSSLDVSNNVALTMLDLGNNWLADMDVFDNVGLLSLDVRENLPRDLDLSNNISLQMLEYGGNSSLLRSFLKTRSFDLTASYVNIDFISLNFFEASFVFNRLVYSTRLTRFV
jgi:hypothetical protein